MNALSQFISLPEILAMDRPFRHKTVTKRSYGSRGAGIETGASGPTSANAIAASSVGPIRNEEKPE